MMRSLLTTFLLHGVTLLIVAAQVPLPDSQATPAGSERARRMLENFPSRGQRHDATIPPRSPEETVASFRLMSGLEAEVVLHEPLVTQPLFMNFDERGRLWVVQYIQYPYPAGLKIVDLGDQFHAAYDKQLKPPPGHVRGADRITIHEDTNGDGQFDTHKVFLDGLNMVTSVEFGPEGVWVLNPPFLLFFPDHDGNDLPDSSPQVHLSGFGLEDTHSAANNLTWGPDGWLWGAQGSGVTANIRRPGLDEPGEEFSFKGQAIWRYHPVTRAFELFAEGGGNTFSLFFDSRGQVYSGTNGGGVRGYHYVQGGFYSKNFGEHGYLTNPYSFGYFGAMAHNWESPRFSQTMIFYEEGQLGPAFENHFIAGNALQNRIELTRRIPVGSTYRTEDVNTLLETDDRWFRPVHTVVGPDGAVYVADWYDTRLTHMDPRDNWDRERGRIYRIQANGYRPERPVDLGEQRSDLLVDLLIEGRPWYQRTALRLLRGRKDRSTLSKLKSVAQNPAADSSLEALWGLDAAGGIDADVLKATLRHPAAEVRLWSVRFLGDAAPSLVKEIATELWHCGRTEKDAQVRSQLASTARRLPSDVAIPLTHELMSRSEDIDDMHIPLLLWWSIEAFCETEPDAVLESFLDPGVWEMPIVRQHIIHRLARRFASYLTPRNQSALATLARMVPEDLVPRLREGVLEAFRGRGIETLSSEVERLLFTSSPETQDATEISLGLKRGREGSLIAALGLVAVEDAEARSDRIALMEALSDVKAPEAIPLFLELLQRSPDQDIRHAALRALGRFNVPRIPAELLRIWSDLDPALQRHGLSILASRKSWARELLSSVGRSGVIPKSDIPDEIVDQIRRFGDRELIEVADRYFGKASAVEPETKQSRLKELIALLVEGPAGNAQAGRDIYDLRCGICHKLSGRGLEIGPDLSGYEWANTEAILLSIVDPSAGIREGYTTFEIETRDDRQLLGFITERDPETITLKELSGQSTIIAIDEIVLENPIDTSLMPESLLDDLSPDQIRDLFAYLQTSS